MTDLSRLLWADLPLICSHVIEGDCTEWRQELRGGISTPTWGDDGDELHLRFCHFVTEQGAMQQQTYRIPVVMLESLHAATGAILAERKAVAPTGQVPDGR